MAVCTAVDIANALNTEADAIAAALGTIATYCQEQYPNDPSAGIAGIYNLLDQLTTAFTHMQATMYTLSIQT